MPYLLTIAARLASGGIPTTSRSRSTSRELSGLLLRLLALTGHVPNPPAVEASSPPLDLPLNSVDGFFVQDSGVDRGKQAVQLFLIHCLLDLPALVNVFAALVRRQDVAHSTLGLYLFAADRVDDRLAELLVGLALGA